MSKHQALKQLKEDPCLYLSYSQIFTYLGCSQKYRFHYVEGRHQERISANLILGSAIHSALERYYLTLMEKGITEPLGLLETLIEEGIRLDLKQTDVPVIFKKEAPDKESLISLGKSLIQTFYENIDLTGYRIIGAEVPLSANLYDEHGQPTEFKLLGVIDLLLMDSKGEVVVVDNKTAAKAKSQSALDDDLQFSAYSYLLASNRMTLPKADIKCRMDVLRKLKTPKMEQLYTIRTAEDRRRFSKFAVAVLNGIESRVFIPSHSWLCADCQFINACKSW